MYKMVGSVLKTAPVSRAGPGEALANIRFPPVSPHPKQQPIITTLSNLKTSAELLKSATFRRRFRTTSTKPRKVENKKLEFVVCWPGLRVWDGHPLELHIQTAFGSQKPSQEVTCFAPCSCGLCHLSCFIPLDITHLEV